MRQFFTISLIAVHLLGNTELGQIISLPKLVYHFHQHKATNHLLSFTTFLAMHYGGNDGSTADDNDDNQLPFHQLHHPGITFAATEQHTASFKSKLFSFRKKQQFYFAPENINDVFLDSIFHPPLTIV